MSEATAPQVMISYARKDARDFAGRLAAELRLHDITVWLDTSEIEGGAEWLRSIEQAIAGCKVFVAVRSPLASDSFWVRNERLYALNRRKPPEKPRPHIVPVLATPCAADDLELIGFQPVDFTHSFEMALPRLVERIRELSNGHAPEVKDRRTLELAYLGRILLEHAIWQDLYTPMAGVARMSQRGSTPDRPRMVTAPNRIGQKFSEKVREQFHHEENLEVVQREYEDILPAVEQMRQMVILGDPGCGKTTTLWRITAEYAERAKVDKTVPLPVFVRLGALRSDETLTSQIQATLGELGEHDEALLAEKRLVILLDGLNELPTENRAKHLEQARALVQHCLRDNLLVAVTCRELDYSSELDLNIPRQVHITPLDPQRIRQFVNGYIKEPADAGDALFWQLAGGDQVRATWSTWERAGATFELFWTAEDIPRENPDVFSTTSGTQDALWREAVHGGRSMMQLARNPYMLYMMTQVFTEEAAIPHNRGKLFQLFVDFLLRERERLNDAAAEDLTTRLAGLAYQMQAQGKAGTTIRRADALAVLGDEQRLYQAQSANILGGTDEIRFTHQLLQEYFAAHKLDREMRSGGSAADYWPPENWWEPQGWEETAILLAGLYNDDCTPVIEWLGDANPELAARCVLESGAHTPGETLQALQPRWLSRLADVQQEPRPPARAAVGRAASLLNLDSRSGVVEFAWCEVPAGKFRMGGDPDAFNDWDGAEFDLGYPFWIAKYPVTYAQYEAFVSANGYENETYWTPDGLKWRGEKRQPEALWNDPKWHIANHPVVGVTWYESYAYSQWLNDQPGVKPANAPAGYVIRLARECEWEKATRHPDGRLFPWGNEWDPARLTSSEGGIGRTSAVGLYPNGANLLHGACDLCGNVWEWCLTQWQAEYQSPDTENNDLHGDALRVLRGGSWGSGLYLARAAVRLFNVPSSRSYSGGVRVVCTPPI